MAWAQNPSSERGANQGVSNRTRRTATIHWQRVPLRDALGRMNELFDEPVFVDRRVDPSQRVSLDIEAASLGEVLERLSASVSLGSSRIQRAHYLGPAAAAGQLRTIAAARADEVRRLPAAQRGTLERKEPVTWPRLTEPRPLVSGLIEGRGWRIGGAERIPHDLWAEGKLPALALSDQLTMLLLGFDLTFEVKPAERMLQIVPLTPLTVNRRYRLPRELSNPETLLQQVPAATGQVIGETLSVDGRVEDHERLIELLGGNSRRKAASRLTRETKQVYTLRVQEQPVGAVLKELGTRLGWAFEIEAEAIRGAGLSLEKRVSFSVQNSDADELLEAVLRPAGLDYRREGDQLRIVPRGLEK